MPQKLNYEKDIFNAGFGQGQRQGREELLGEMKALENCLARSLDARHDLETTLATVHAECNRLLEEKRALIGAVDWVEWEEYTEFEPACCGVHGAKEGARVALECMDWAAGWDL